MKESRLTLLIFLAPTLFFVLVFIAYPVVYSAYLSLSEYNYASDPTPKFIGFKGYIETIFEDSMFHTALINQFKFAVPYFVITFLASLILAILINELRFGASFFQVIFYLPMVIPLSLVGITFAWLLFPDVGIFNHFLRSLGVSNWNIDWYGDPKTALNSLVVARSWKMIGFTLIILLSGLQGLSKSLREAAKVDGANFFQEIWYIVLPNLKPYLLISGVWILINAMKTFELVAVVTQGGPGMATLTLYYYTWKLAFERLDMGRASQVAYITAVIIVLFSWGLNRLFKPETASRA
ncbi:MAG: sugar ABC transporter permease [Thermotogae bacterium]|nr:sugar ABC transporter permease [Thermotogota bacterium]